MPPKLLFVVDGGELKCGNDPENICAFVSGWIKWDPCHGGGHEYSADRAPFLAESERDGHQKTATNIDANGELICCMVGLPRLPGEKNDDAYSSPASSKASAIEEAAVAKHGMWQVAVGKHSPAATPPYRPSG